MNKGIVTKVFVEKNGKKEEVFYNIRLDRNVEDKENGNYNIYVDLENKKTYIFNSDAKCEFASSCIIIALNNKCNFKLDLSNYKIDDNSGFIKILAIDYER